jgi:hypothetical protein
MNTNVGEMPLDIFSDYISDILGEDWSWEYFGLIVNGFGTEGRPYQQFHYQFGVGGNYDTFINAYGIGVGTYCRVFHINDGYGDGSNVYGCGKQWNNTGCG